METCEYGATGKPVKDCERYKTLQAENEALKKAINYVIKELTQAPKEK